MELDEDATAMIAASKGDRRAFAGLFDRHQASVVRFCARFVGSVAQAEDLAQDIFVKLYRNAGSYRPEAKFTTFLFRIATNHCLNEVRRGKQTGLRTSERRKSDDDERDEYETAGAASPDCPHEELQAKQLEGAVRRALDGMSERERAAFCMCRFEGLAYKEIAAALDASEAAVKSLIHRATLQVAKHLEPLRSNAEPARSTP